MEKFTKQQQQQHLRLSLFLNIFPRCVQKLFCSIYPEASSFLRLFTSKCRFFFLNIQTGNTLAKHQAEKDSFSYNISHRLLRPSQFLKKFMKILEWFTLQKKIRPLPPTQCCSILAEQRHRSLCQETVSDTCKQH